jgi:hypothetical protein
MTPAQPTNSSIDRMPDGNGVRNVPMRIYLPDNIPVMQAQSGPVDENGKSISSEPVQISHSNLHLAST